MASQVAQQEGGGGSGGLFVEISGTGVLNSAEGTSGLFIITVSQPTSSWTVYRRVATFQALSQHLSAMVPTLQACPPVADNQLEAAREGVQGWLHNVLLIPGVAQTPVMRNFLCAEANLPPPGLDIAWSKGSKSSFDDEMEMDELFDR
mmetsp:Transcript_4175/g.8963  ORF Transcript_4175/g.8963 Transcript_4175/m.8963 type:complete len:148 (-) Transcript_4175:248-691(-)